jgi:primosomal protein N' (replication factor Y)
MSEQEAVAAVPVLVPVPVDEPFDYLVPPGSPAPGPGCFVRVPFGRQEVVGVVWHRQGRGRVAPERLKRLRGLIDAPPMPASVRALVEHLAAETLVPLGAALRLALPVPAALDPWPAKLGYRRGAAAAPAKPPAARARVLAAPAAGSELPRQGAGRAARGEPRPC